MLVVKALKLSGSDLNLKNVHAVLRVPGVKRAGFKSPHATSNHAHLDKFLSCCGLHFLICKTRIKILFQGYES